MKLTVPTKKTPSERRRTEDFSREKRRAKKYEREKIRHDNKLVQTTHLSYDDNNDWYVLDIHTGVRQDQVSPYAVHITGKHDQFFTHSLEHLEYSKGETAIELCLWMCGGQKFDKALLFKPSLSNQIDIKKIGMIALIGVVALFILSGGL